MVQEISTPIILQHTNIVVGSEVVSVKGASIPALIRNSDYIIDYQAGEIKFLENGVALELADLIKSNGLDVTYSYQLPLDRQQLFESQKEVFNEPATYTDNFTLQVKNSPIQLVTRIFNLTTQELYLPSSVHENTIVFSGDRAPQIKTFIKQQVIFDEYFFNFETTYFTNTYSIQLPSYLDKDLNTILEISQDSNTSKYQRLLVIGGVENLNSTLQTLVPFETEIIELSTGGKTLKNSKQFLIKNQDYTFELSNIVQYSDCKLLTIFLTAQGIQKIRTNNLYLKLGFRESIKLSPRASFTTTSQYVNDFIVFQNNESQLASYPRCVITEDLQDRQIELEILVADPSTGMIMEKGKDYSINFFQKKIYKIESGRLKDSAIVFYLEPRVLEVAHTTVTDVIYVDYVWSTNSLNWNTYKKQISVSQKEYLHANTQFIILNSAPLDYTKIIIRKQDDINKNSITKIINYNAQNQRLQIQPISTSGEYIVEYETTSQPIAEGTPYFVTYKYGADKDVLKNKFAKLVGIEQTQILKEDIVSLSAGSTSIKLIRNPLDVASILIFLEDDLTETPQATAEKFDNKTGTLYFSSIRSSGKYVIRYLVEGFDTNNLRIAIQKLFESFSIGPTLAGFNNLISGFVSTAPEIKTGLSSRFTIANSQHTAGNQLALKGFEPSPNLKDNTSSIKYVPARFNLGILLERSRQGFVRAPAASNISLDEGTLEFLVGTLFDTQDNDEHFFIDIGNKTTPNKNRFCLYKSKNNKLNFDIWDNDGQLFRSSLDVRQTYYTELIQLKAGDSTTILKYNATPAFLDLNSNFTPDLYEGLETKFIIMPQTPSFPETYKKAFIKVYSYDAPTKTLTFQPVEYSGLYLFSYVSGLAAFEETENMIALTWKLHTLDGTPPFYRLYVNGKRVQNQTLQNFNFTIEDQDSNVVNTYDSGKYDTSKYQ